MEIASSEARQALHYLSSAQRHGYSPTAAELDAYAGGPTPRFFPAPGSGLTRWTSDFEEFQRSKDLRAGRASFESFAAYLIRVGWAAVVPEKRLSVTALGNAVLGAMNDEAALDIQMVVAKAIDPEDPFAYAKVISDIPARRMPLNVPAEPGDDAEYGSTAITREARQQNDDDPADQSQSHNLEPRKSADRIRRSDTYSTSPAQIPATVHRTSATVDTGRVRQPPTGTPRDSDEAGHPAGQAVPERVLVRTCDPERRQHDGQLACRLLQVVRARRRFNLYGLHLSGTGRIGVLRPAEQMQISLALSNGRSKSAFMRT